MFQHCFVYVHSKMDYILWKMEGFSHISFRNPVQSPPKWSIAWSSTSLDLCLRHVRLMGFVCGKTLRNSSLRIVLKTHKLSNFLEPCLLCIERTASVRMLNKSKSAINSNPLQGSGLFAFVHSLAKNKTITNPGMDAGEQGRPIISEANLALCYAGSFSEYPSPGIKHKAPRASPTRTPVPLADPNLARDKRPTTLHSQFLPNSASNRHPTSRIKPTRFLGPSQRTQRTDAPRRSIKLLLRQFSLIMMLHSALARSPRSITLYCNCAKCRAVSLAHCACHFALSLSLKRRERWLFVL